MAFMEDLKARLAGRIQLTTGGHQAYVAPVGLNFRQEIVWAQIQKTYRSDPTGERRYSPPVCTGMKTRILKETETPPRSQQATSSDRTSPCGWACAALRD